MRKTAITQTKQMMRDVDKWELLGVIKRPSEMMKHKINVNESTFHMSIYI